jgi:hypothetical protein
VIYPYIIHCIFYEKRILVMQCDLWTVFVCLRMPNAKFPVNIGRMAVTFMYSVSLYLQGVEALTICMIDRLSIKHSKMN